MTTDPTEALVSLRQVRLGVRTLWGISAAAVLLISWWLLTGYWAWIVAGVTAVITFCFSPAVIVAWRYSAVVAKSPASRLEHPNVWTMVGPSMFGGANQMVRLEDGHLVYVSVGRSTAKVYVKKSLGSLASEKVASFRIRHLRQGGLPNAEAILGELRTAIGSPQSVADLRRSLEKLKDSGWPR